MKAVIVNKENLTPNIFSIWLETKEKFNSPYPGQFFQVNTEATFLNRAFSVCDTSEKLLRLVFKVRGRGTKWISEQKEGDILELYGPYGNGIRTIKEKRVILVGGGVGISPLLYITKFFPDKNFFIIEGARTKAELILKEELEFVAKKVIYTTNDGSFGKKGNVTDFLDEVKGDVMFICGPLEMLKAVQKKNLQLPIYGLLESKLGCGAGLCFGCGVKKKNDGYLRVCTDGPVVKLSEVEL